MKAVKTIIAVIIVLILLVPTIVLTVVGVIAKVIADSCSSGLRLIQNSISSLTKIFWPNREH